MRKFDRLLTSYDYRLPKEAIAEVPAAPRDAARLLVFRPRTNTVVEDTFAHLAEYLPKGTLLVFNETKVIPARLVLVKETGGRVEALFLSRNGRKVHILARGKLHPGDVLTLRAKRFTVLDRSGTEATLRMEFSPRGFGTLLHRAGTTPLPPYLKRSPLSESERRKRYQTVFARLAGSIAAPTASLHFTRRLLGRLRKRGIESTYIALHVHLGTFAPLTEHQIKEGKLHEEHYVIPSVSARAIEKAKRKGRPVIAVGTTVVRALETATTKGRVRTGGGTTQLFIRPGYRFRTVDGIITNFHVPRSSLLMLVAAFTGRKRLLQLYATAQRKEFRFLSFGDGMLVLPHGS